MCVQTSLASLIGFGRPTENPIQDLGASCATNMNLELDYADKLSQQMMMLRDFMRLMQIAKIWHSIFVRTSLLRSSVGNQI